MITITRLKQHRVVAIDHHYNIHEDSDVFTLTFEYAGESHEMLCAVEHSERGDNIGISHTDCLDAGSEMDEHVMENMARNILEHWYMFNEETLDHVPPIRCQACYSEEFRVYDGQLQCLGCDVVYGEVEGGMTPIRFDITNERYVAHDEFLVCNYSGEHEDLPPRVKELLTVQQMEELDAGHWIVIADGEIVSTGEFAPHTINYA